MVDTERMKLTPSLESLKERNMAYANMKTRKDMIQYHRQWFAGFVPVKGSKEVASDKKPKYIFNLSTCKPKPVLMDHLALFIDLHDSGFLPLEWQFGCSKKQRNGKLRERVSYVSGLMDRTLAERLDYALCGHSQMMMFISDLTEDIVTAGESKDPATIVKAVKDDEMPHGSGAEFSVERYGAARVSQSFPNWNMYTKLAEFLEDKNIGLCCDIFKHMVLVHIIDKQWFKATPMFSALQRVLNDLNDVRIRDKIDKGLSEEEKDHEKLLICNSIYALNPNYASIAMLYARPIEDLKIVYLDMVHNHDRAAGKLSSVSTAIQALAPPVSIQPSIRLNELVLSQGSNQGSQQAQVVEPAVLANLPITELAI
jgi:hypothetical protein